MKVGDTIVYSKFIDSKWVIWIGTVKEVRHSKTNGRFYQMALDNDLMKKHGLSSGKDDNYSFGYNIFKWEKQWGYQEWVRNNRLKEILGEI